MSEYKIRNAHCVYFEGQTGLCKAKEFVKCNPVNCKLYAIDELSTIVDLQEQLKRKEKECEELKEQLNQAKYLSEGVLRLYSERQNIKYKQTLNEIEEFANKACKSCKKFFPNFQSNINCACCQPSLILGIINQTKENN